MGITTAWGPEWTTFWRRHTRSGVVLTFLVAAAVGLRMVARPETVDALQVVLLVALPALTCLVLLVPVDRLVQHAHGWTFFTTWEVLGVLVVGYYVWLDGGLTSPLVLVWYVLLMHAASAYPAAWTAVAAAPVLAIHVVLLVGAAPEDRVYVAEHLLVAGTAAGFAVWASANRYDYLRQVARQAQFDDLTGCANRRAFHERLGAEQPEATPSRPLSVVLLDLDHFKQLNDTHGHAAGDAVLATVGALLREQAPPRATAGRLGGDELGLVLPGVDADAAAELAEQVRRRLVAALAPTGVTASVGTATAGSPGEATRLLLDADRAVYRAKASGRSRVVRHESAGAAT